MKISVIITTLLVAQVSASFFDVFHGAVLSVQNSFGKLLSDVVTDVKETVDCTILAVEHVLSLGHDATTRYYDKCSSGINKTDSVSEPPQDTIVPKVEVTFNLPNNKEERQQKVIPAQIDARINERFSKALGIYKPHDNVLSIQNVLAKESEQIAGFSVLIKKELEKITNEVTINLKNIEKQRDSKPSIDTILQELKVLEQGERNAKNTSEGNEIHQLIDQILGKLDAIQATEATENVKLEELRRELENNSTISFVGLRHQFEEWKEEEARHLSEIKSKLEEHEKISNHHHGLYKRHGSNQIQPYLLNTNMNRDDSDPFSSSSKTSGKNTTLVIEVLDSSTSSTTIKNSNDMTIIPVSHESLFPQNKTFAHSGLIDIVITSNSYSTNRIGSDAILSTNQSTSTPNNLTGDDTKLIIAALSITENTPIKKDVEPVWSELAMDSDKQQKFTRNETASVISTDGNNSTQCVILIQTPEISAVEDETLPIRSNTVSGKEETTDSVTKYDIVIVESLMTEVISTSQNNNNSNASANSSTDNPLVKNTYVNATGFENETSTILPSYELATTRVVATFDDIQSTDTMITNISHSINANETIIPIENSTTTGNVKTSTDVTVNEYGTKITSTSLPIVENTPKSETIQSIDTATVTSKQEFTKNIVRDNNSKDIITSSSLPNVENSLRDNIQTEQTSTNSSNNTTISSDSSPMFKYTKVRSSQTTEPVESTMTSSNEESLIDSKESIIAKTKVKIKPVSDIIEENTKVSSYEESTEAVREFITTTEIEHDTYTTVTSALTLNISTLKNETFGELEITTDFLSEEESLYSTATESPNSENDDDSSTIIVKSTKQTISEKPPEENVAESEYDKTLTSTTNSPIYSPTTLVHTESHADTTTSTTFSLLEITTVSEIIDLESTNSTENEQPIILPKTRATIPDEIAENIQINETNTTSSNNTTISSDSSPIVEYTTASQIIEPVGITATSGNEESLNDSKESIIANTSLTIVKIKPVSDTIEENTKVSSYEESTEAVTEFITTTQIEHDSYTTVMSALTSNISTFESETIEDIDITTVSLSEEDSLESTATESPNSENDDSSGSIVKSTTQTISEKIPEENVAESENDETLKAITDSPIDSATTLVHTESYTDTSTSTTFSLLKLTTVSEIIDLESTTSIENEEPVILPKTRATIPDHVSNENTEINDTVSSFTENADSAFVTENLKTVETTTGSGEDLSSTSTGSAINEVVTTSTAFPSTERISENIISSRNEVDLRNSPSLKANTFSRTQNIPDFNYMTKDTPLKITESPPVHRELLTANKLNQQNYNTNAASRNNYDINAPISLSDPSLQTIQPLMNPGVLNRMTIYDESAMPPIARGLFKEAQKQANAFAIVDSIHKRLSHLDSPFAPKDERRTTVLPPLHPVRPLSFDNSFLGNANRPQGLTTHRPRNANKYKIPSVDYDSFFHTPPRNAEAHQRALKEARQIIANSKRSDRFINYIMKNKNKFNARNIFNG